MAQVKDRHAFPPPALVTSKAFSVTLLTLVAHNGDCPGDGGGGDSGAVSGTLSALPRLGAYFVWDGTFPGQVLRAQEVP